MKKKILVLIIVLLIIIVIVAIKNNNSKSKIKYEIASVDVYNYIKFKDGKNFGVIDRNGKIIIEAAYKDIVIPNPSKDLFLCYEEENGMARVINANKETILKEYDKIEAIKIKNMASTLCYEKAILKYQKDGKFGIIDFTGKEITKNEYNSIENLQGTEGKCQVEKDGKYGVINQNGKELIDTEYDKVETDRYYNEQTKYVQAGFIVSNATQDGYRYGYIDYTGKKVLDTEYNELVRIVNLDEEYLIASKNGKFGLYKEEKQILKNEYQSISYTDNGAVIIEKNEEYGISNLNGEIKLKPKYTEFEENGIYLYMTTPEENSVYDVEGNKIDINFNKAVFDTENENYKITTLLNNDVTYYGVEDKDGKILIESKYRYIEYVCDNYFIVEDENEKYGVINTSGTEKIAMEYDFIQKIKNKNIVQAQKPDSKKIEIYSSKMVQVIKMKNAKIQNYTDCIKVYNNKESIYLDTDGNKIEENSDIVQSELKKELPEKIGDYKKMQYSLEDVYYEK